MAKGTKRAIPIEKIEKKNSRAVCFTKRRDGLFSKAADLCLLSDGSQIAILATPSSSSSSSSRSSASFFSFGHSSVDAVVAAFLAGKRAVHVPFHREDDVAICLRRKGLGLGFWWDDERLAESEDPEELRAAINSVSRLLSDLKGLRSGEALDIQSDRHQTLKKKEVKKSHETQELHQTLNLQPSCAISNDHYLNTDTEIPAISEIFCNNNNAEMEDLDQLIDFDSLLFDDEISDNTLQEDFYGSDLVMNSEAVDDHSMRSANPHMFSGSEAEAVENGAFVLHSGFGEEDNLRFSDAFDGLTTIAAL